MSVASRILILLLCSSFAGAEDLMVTLAGRPVGTVRVLGGTESDTRFALNNLRSLTGSPVVAAIVRADIRRLTELGRFSEVVAKVTERPDGAVDWCIEWCSRRSSVRSKSKAIAGSVPSKF